MKLLDEYFRLQKEVHDYFGYVENWRVIPLDDQTDMYWRLNGEGPGTVTYANSPEELESEEGNCYEDEIYTQRFLTKWVYRGKDYTLVCCDPHTDMNTFLRVFENTKEKPE